MQQDVGFLSDAHEKLEMWTHREVEQGRKITEGEGREKQSSQEGRSPRKRVAEEKLGQGVFIWSEGPCSGLLSGGASACVPLVVGRGTCRVGPAILLILEWVGQEIVGLEALGHEFFKNKMSISKDKGIWQLGEEKNCVEPRSSPLAGQTWLGGCPVCL